LGRFHDKSQLFALIQEHPPNADFGQLANDPAPGPATTASPARWAKRLTTATKSEKSTTGFFVNEVELPQTNPRKRSIPIAGLDFFSRPLMRISG
jgi:hypothetical protein